MQSNPSIIKPLVGPTGLEPVTFTLKRRLAVPTGFSRAPEALHPSFAWGQQTRKLSGALNGRHLCANCRHTLLDYGPTVLKNFRFQIYRFLKLKRKVNEGQLPKGIGVAGHRARDPPEPIPNSVVKPCSVPGFSVVFGHAKPGKLAAPSPILVHDRHNLRSYFWEGLWKET